MATTSRLPEERLAALYIADDFGGAKTMRAKVIRELIDEIRLLRRGLEDCAAEQIADLIFGDDVAEDPPQG